MKDWILLECECGNRDSLPPPVKVLPVCSAGCGKTMYVIGVETRGPSTLKITERK